MAGQEGASVPEQEREGEFCTAQTVRRLLYEALVQTNILDAAVSIVSNQ